MLSRWERRASSGIVKALDMRRTSCNTVTMKHETKESVLEIQLANGRCANRKDIEDEWSTILEIVYGYQYIQALSNRVLLLCIEGLKF